MIVGRYDFSGAAGTAKATDGGRNSQAASKAAESAPKDKSMTVTSAPSAPGFATTLAEALKGGSDAQAVTDKLQSAKTSGDKGKLKTVAQEFESLFLNMMFKQMRSTIGEGGLMEKSYGRSVYEDMYYEELAQSISKGGGFGLGDTLYKQMVNQYVGDEQAGEVGDKADASGEAKAEPASPATDVTGEVPAVGQPVENPRYDDDLPVPAVDTGYDEKAKPDEDDGRGKIEGTRYEFF